MSEDHFKLNDETNKFINDLNKNIMKDLNYENGSELQILLDYRKNLIDIPEKQYEVNAPDDLILAYYKRFTLLAYMHITLHNESIGIEYVKTIDNYQNQKRCKFLLSVLIGLSRLINPNINMIHLDSINYKISYLCIFEFDAIPQITYYNSRENNFVSDIKDENKCKEFNIEILKMQDKTKEEKYKYIEKFDAIYGNDLFLIIDINDSLVERKLHYIKYMVW